MIALVAGTGTLPAILCDRLLADGEVPVVCELAGFEADAPGHLPRIGFRIETFGTLLATLRRMGVGRVCLAGAVRRPAIDPATIDAATMPLVPRLRAALARGDDGALREVVALFEEAGMTVLGATDIAPELVADAGVLAGPRPDAGQRADAALGQSVIAELGAADAGQACIVRAGTVLAREGPDGTDAMIAALDAGGAAGRPSPEPAARPGAGALLVKGPKPGQDRRIDLPTIGPDTARAAARAGLAGIVIEAGGVILLDRGRTVALCDEAGLLLWARGAGAP